MSPAEGSKSRLRDSQTEVLRLEWDVWKGYESYRVQKGLEEL